MNGIERSNETERKGLAVMVPYMQRLSTKAQIVSTNGQLYLQKHVGDFLAKIDGRMTAVECKTEEKFTGNLFLESWSNRSKGVRGWVDYCFADVYWYYFLDVNRLYTFPVQSLRDWAYGKGEAMGAIYRYQEKPVLFDQLNDTWGRAVPISTLAGYVEGFKGPIDPMSKEHDREVREQLTMFS